MPIAHYNGDAEGWLDQLLVLKALVLCACYVPKGPLSYQLGA